jgi:hypothetical protein
MMYSHVFPIIKYYFCCIYSNMYNNICTPAVKDFHMVGLDDCSFLQPGYLVGSRLGGTHDLLGLQNPSISWLLMLK